MTERIDHAAEAVSCIQYAHTTTGERRTEAVAQAQVHAALALVEQQAIANRIALAVAIRGDLELGDSAGELSDWLHEGNGVLGYSSEAEQEALGL